MSLFYPQNSSEDSSSEASTSENNSEPQSDSELLPINGNQLTVSASSTSTPVHSTSSETLKAQSLPNSPSVLSSTTSSATLVGSMDSKNDSPRPSPVMKDAPESIPEVSKSAQTEIKSSQSIGGGGKNITDLPNCLSPSKTSITCTASSTITTTTRETVVTFQTTPITTPASNLQSSSTTTSISASTPTMSFALPFRATPSKSSISASSASRYAGNQLSPGHSAASNYLRVRSASSKRGSSDAESISYATQSSTTTPRSSFQTESTGLSTPRSSFQLAESTQMSSKAGVVVTSSRASSRRSSTASAASAFAVATAASRYILYDNKNTIIVFNIYSFQSIAIHQIPVSELQIMQE